MTGALIGIMLLLTAATAVPDAVITEDHEVFTLTSTTSGELSVSRTVVVNGKDGIDAATLVLYCDSFRQLQSFSGSIQSGSAKPVKLKKSDLVSLSYSSGLVADDTIYSYQPSGHFPLTVHYEYKIACRNGISSFPSFFPVDAEKVAVIKADYTVSVPTGYGIKEYSSPYLKHSVRSEKGRDLYHWQLEDFNPVVSEDLMPPVAELLPFAYVSPETITLGGYNGSQKNWKELGAWLYQIQKGCQNLTEQEALRVQALTSGCGSDLEKLRVIYAYFRERTRYVSIQLGIGGYRPFPASEVSRTGFGDCKGLSNYMKSLLAAVGIESEYYVINTDKANLPEGYASPGQMNHAMVAVPLPQLSDTAWVECTNPAFPLGYRHGAAAGHQVLLVKADGGELVRIPAYPDSLSVCRNKMDVTLDRDGSAAISARRELQLDQLDPYIGFDNLLPAKQAQKLTSGLKIQPYNVKVTGITDNFADYSLYGKDYLACMNIDFCFTTGAYGNVSANRIFVPMNPASQGISIQKSARVNELYMGEGFSLEEEFTIHIPEGYRLENLPGDIAIESKFGRITSSAVVSPDGRTIEVKQVLRCFSFRVPASEYASYRNFARAVNSAYAATIVLVTDLN